MLRRLPLVVALLMLSGCAEVELASHVAKNAMGSSGATAAQQGNFKVGNPYKIDGTTYYPKETYSHSETGIASWYGPGFQGKKTASGERFDTQELTAAHRTLQMPSLVRITNLDNGRSVVVRVNDRGPFARGRVIDVSQRAAELLDFKNRGTAKVRLDLLPEESMQVATLARSGQTTKGMEVAVNQGRMVPGAISSASDPAITMASYDAPTDGMGAGGEIGSVSVEALEPVAVHQSADGRAMPDPVVTQMAVERTNIFVQAGSFTVYDNAQRLSQTLARIGHTSIDQAHINGKTFYRVRVGPAPDVKAADQMLSRVLAMGQDKAVIIVD